MNIPELEQRVLEMEAKLATSERDLAARLAATERELAAWRRLTVDPASGGGQVSVGVDRVILRINSLTESGAQLP